MSKASTEPAEQASDVGHCALSCKCSLMHACHMQVDASSAQLAHDQAAIDYCFKSALDYKVAGMTAAQAVLKVLTTLKEVADSAQVRRLLSNILLQILGMHSARVDIKYSCLAQQHSSMFCIKRSGTRIT